MFFNLEIYSILEFLRDRFEKSEAQRLFKESMTRPKVTNLSAFIKTRYGSPTQKARDTVSK